MRHKYNKRKEAFLKSQKAPKRRFKEEKDKDVFKRRKFIKNVVEEETPDQASSSDEETEEIEAETGYGQMLQMFGGSVMDKHAIESDSENNDNDENDDNEASENDDNSDDDVSDVGDKSQNDELDEEKEDDEEDDLVEEEEEEINNDPNEDNMSSEDEADEKDDATDEIGSIDPFSAHFEVTLDHQLLTAIDNRSKWKASCINSDGLGSLQIQTLDFDNSDVKSKTLMDEGDEEEMLLKENHKKLISQLPSFNGIQHQKYLKQKLKQSSESFDDFSKEIMEVLSLYKDFMFTERTKDNSDQIKMVYTLHCLNHVLKTQTKILNNNSKHGAREDGDERLRDQGFARPKVLIIVPFKESCRSIVEMLIKIFSPNGEKGAVANRKRFNEDYSKVETVKKDKPEDFYDIFQGDVDDSFKLGISVTKKTLKLYTDFYSSDIIITSPLGLRLVTGVEGEGGKTDTDFLSSIEMLIIDQADVLLMQNWDHVTSIITQLHQQPRESHGVDYGRVRLWCLDGNSKYYRQNIVISSVPAPEINSIWNRNCHNYMGKVRVMKEHPGTLTRVLTDTSLVWHRVSADNLAHSLDTRFKYFTEKVMPGFTKDSMYHTCVFVPSYFDYVKVRNWFKSSDLDYCQVNEYTKDKKIAQARDMFYHNEKHFLLYTERCHFYRRFRIKGIRHLIFYQPPTFDWMFAELCNLLQKSFQNPRGGSESNMSITILYTKYDIQRLNLCVGNETASKMLSSENSRHIFKAGGGE